MTGAAIEVRVGGVPVRSLGYVGDVAFSHTLPGGCAEASWGMAGLAKGVASSVLRRGARVVYTVGGFPIWQGILSQPGADMESFSATGLFREASRFMALDNTGAPTYDLDAAIVQAIADGMPWIYDGGAPTGISTDKAEYLSDLIAVSSTAAAVRAGVGPDGRAYFRADPTTPTLHAVPGAGVMGQADDDYASRVKGEYVSALAGTPPVPSATAIATATLSGADELLYGTSMRFVDLKPRGLLTSTEANAVVSGMLALAGPRVGFTERLELADYQLLRDGSPACLALVREGEMVRVHGAINPGQSVTGSNFLDMVVAETSYVAGAQTITLAPLGLAPRTLADVLAVTAVEESFA
ncbi:hypothetical protein FB382_004344 [Nocardioides ginsengisegetis]|uniref:Uncharacterized protein n=1 Tax=Nocardioides ginsengisegetis TaxID=661491 RepID=A0A7W3J4E6_9ACTN|nr:hypothetical protein [Nocardioides ginsengisegetis]MBA8805999.1 hypothetical protein [Nocardioides ginsengisegetis]